MDDGFVLHYVRAHGNTKPHRDYVIKCKDSTQADQWVAAIADNDM